MTPVVRPALPDDVPAMSRVLIASITQLCQADHGNDPAIVASWIANKSEDGVMAMLSSAESDLFVVEKDEGIVGVGAISGPAIVLNYVDPPHRHTGVSSALLAALERELIARGVTMAELKSTATARAFYLSQGWVETAPAKSGRFIAAFPMRKGLT